MGLTLEPLSFSAMTLLVQSLNSHNCSRNDLEYVECDIKPYYTVPYHTVVYDTEYYNRRCRRSSHVEKRKPCVWPLLQGIIIIVYYARRQQNIT